jgi:tRNA threonylcarbamoyladenosine biosynthesis protein TsaE
VTHSPILETATLHWPEEAACAQSAAALAAANPQDAVITLEGELGAGKTTFVRHLLQALGVPGHIKSPTYAVMETYDLGLCCVAHFDFFRFQDPQEWEDAGFRDVFAQPGLKICEWPQKAGGLMPRPDLSLRLQVQTQGDRQVQVQACSPEGLRLLAFLKPA